MPHRALLSVSCQSSQSTLEPTCLVVILNKTLWEKRTKLEVSRPLTSDFTTKPQSSEQHSVGTKTDSQINRTEQSPEITPHTYSQSTYSTGGKETNGGKSHWIATCKELEHFRTPHTKINLKSIKGLNVRPKTTKLLEENIGSGSDGRELACNTGDLGLIPGLGGSPGEGNGTLFQYSCWRIPCTEEPSRGFCTRGRKESDTTEWRLPGWLKW